MNSIVRWVKLNPCLAIFWKDVMYEIRSRDTLVSVLVFSLLVIVVFNFGINPNPTNVGVFAPGILWIAFIFGGVLGFTRTFAIEKENDALNGLLLTPDISKKLLDMDLDKIKISLQGASEENYSVMRANPYYKRIINNIKTLVDLRDNTGSDLFIQVSTSITNETKEQTDEFEKFWRNIVDDFYSDITTFRRLRGVQKVEEFIKDHKIKNERLLRQKKCVDVRTRLVVHADGYVPICCSDFRREILIGNANKQTLKEIWNSPKLTKIRQILENNEKDKIPFCSLCFNLR